MLNPLTTKLRVWVRINLEGGYKVSMTSIQPWVRVRVPTFKILRVRVQNHKHEYRKLYSNTSAYLSTRSVLMIATRRIQGGCIVLRWAGHVPPPKKKWQLNGSPPSTPCGIQSKLGGSIVLVWGLPHCIQMTLMEITTLHYGSKVKEVKRVKEVTKCVCVCVCLQKSMSWHLPRW